MPRRYYRRRRQVSNQDTLVTVCVVTAVAIMALATNLLSGNPQNMPPIIYLLAIGGACILAAILGTQYWLARRRRQRMLLLTMADIDTMLGSEFEKYVAELFRRKGYNVALTKASGDYGVDLVMARAGVRTAVQIKRYRKAVRQEAVREAIAGMAFYNCTESMVVTNSYFTRAARALAKSNHCVLLDREKLAELAASVQPTPVR